MDLNLRRLIKILAIFLIATFMINRCNTTEKKTNTAPTENKHNKASCFTGSTGAVDFLKEKAEAIDQAQIMYNTEALSDCSGMFFRMIQALQEKCPNFDYPRMNQARSSRQLAAYYHKRGKLTIIKDDKEASQYLQPGYALFFGRNGETYTRFDIDFLTSGTTGIQHMGLLLEVETENDIVQTYKMFHGRSAGKTAKITTHFRNYKYDDDDKYPPYGNWGQQLVAVARILPEAEL